MTFTINLLDILAWVLAVLTTISAFSAVASPAIPPKAKNLVAFALGLVAVIGIHALLTTPWFS